MNEPRPKHRQDDAPGNQPGEGGSSPTRPLDKSAWRVNHVSIDVARDLVQRFHYAAGGSNTATYAFGVMPAAAVFEADSIAVSWWIPPTMTCAAAIWPTDPGGVLSLSRLVCRDGVPKNTPSFLLSHSQRQIDRTRWPVFVTYADEWQGHAGTIYRAAGWIECGWTKPERTYVKDGRMIARKAGPKTRTHAEMIAIGCEMVGAYRRRRFVNVRRDLIDSFEPIRRRLTKDKA